MIAVDCGAIPDTLVESELFGHEKGAFTGADSAKEGKFEQANKGTLFLDELTNLTEANQMKLLRVLQERKLQRIGGKKIIDVDVRIIAASNVKLADAVREGKFRNDLYYRLNEFHIDIPLLRDRKDDIPVLAKHFIEQANEELNKDVTGFSTEASKILLSYPWPGNIRELKNVVRRAVLLAGQSLITENELHIDLLNPHGTFTSSDNKDTFTIDDATKQVEKDMIIKALQQTGGNKIKAAALLSMNRKTLYRKIKILGIEP
jgi:transcriptional regulator with PAS, ATPase and Fis domain